jgi:hypothetical protein
MNGELKAQALGLFDVAFVKAAHLPALRSLVEFATQQGLPCRQIARACHDIERHQWYAVNGYAMFPAMRQEMMDCIAAM